MIAVSPSVHGGYADMIQIFLHCLDFQVKIGEAWRYFEVVSIFSVLLAPTLVLDVARLMDEGNGTFLFS